MVLHILTSGRFCQACSAVYQIAFWLTEDLIIPLRVGGTFLQAVPFEVKCWAESRSTLGNRIKITTIAVHFFYLVKLIIILSANVYQLARPCNIVIV